MDPNVPPGLMLMSKSPAEEEMEDDEAEWAVRVGNAPPPVWAKRAGEEDGLENGVSKRQRTERVHFLIYDIEADYALISEGPIPAPIQPHGGPNGMQTMHLVDQSILNIAQEFRFTVDEVQEYYDRCGAMDRTHARFKRMREILMKMADDELL